MFIRSIPIVAAIFVMTVLVGILAACGSSNQETAPLRPAVPESDAVSLKSERSKDMKQTSKQYDAPPPMVINASNKYRAVIEMEKGGEIVVELFTQDVPRTVNNFVFLSRDGYYNGVTFHRVIPGFMAQSGDPTGTGSGGPGYSFDNEFSPNARHDGPGVLSMANRGVVNGKGTNGSQFFITFKETHFLDGLNTDGSAKQCEIPGTSCHSVFGKVVAGMDVVNSISVRDPATATVLGDAMKTIRIEESE